jgi:hypothetical protein
MGKAGVGRRFALPIEFGAGLIEEHVFDQAIYTTYFGLPHSYWPKRSFTDRTSILSHNRLFNLDSSVDRFSNGMKTTRHLVFAVLRALAFWVKALRTRWHGQKAAWRRCSSFQGMALLRRRALPAGLLAAHSGASNRGI